MCTRYTLSLFVLLALLIVSCAPPAVDMAALRKTIDEHNAALTEAMMTNDVEKIMGYYADDVIQFPDKAPANKGKDAIRAYINKMMQLGFKITAASYTPTEVNAAGNIAYEIGNYSETMTMGEMPEMNHSGKYVAIWRQQTDGSWKLYAEIWNTNVSPPMEMAEGEKK